MSEPTTRFNDYRAAVTQTIKDVMPDLNECEVQLGRFNLDELETNSIRTPAVRFGILRTKLEPRSDDTSDARLSCAAFAITQGKDRDNAAWTIAEAIGALLRRNQRFGLDDIGAPEDINIGPVLTTSFDRRGISVMAVEWRQKLNGIGCSIFDDDGIVWSELYVNDELVVEIDQP